MQLHFRKTGEGQAIIILHGLFGSGDNWTSFGRNLAAHNYSVYLTDLRNHGHSFWNEDHSYQAMSNDLLEMITTLNLSDVVVMGHSMGGKVAMRFALDHPGKLSSMIVVDIAPRYYRQHHQDILKGLNSIKPDELKSRSEADENLSIYIRDISTRQFLLKNLYWNNDRLAWRFNLAALSSQIENVGEEITGKPVDLPALFINGSESEYIKENDKATIRSLFTNSKFLTIQNAGHWIHADQPEALSGAILHFLGESVDNRKSSL